MIATHGGTVKMECDHELEEGEIIDDGQQENVDTLHVQANMELKNAQQKLEQQNIKEEYFDISQSRANVDMNTTEREINGNGQV